LLDPRFFAPDVGWRLAFFLGGSLGLVILLLRMWIPESPRWLIARGRLAEAEAIVDDIEANAYAGNPPAVSPLPKLKIQPRSFTPLREVAEALFGRHRDRTLVGLSLMAAQAFFYNAIFFTYALVLTDFYGIPADHVGWYILPFALGNFMGPILLGRFFDTVGRRPMIVFTYATSALTLGVTGYLFAENLVSVTALTVCWMVVFFFASAAASSAYLTVSEIFPVEIRALAIAFFYAIGTGAGGVMGPWVFGLLIETGSRASVFNGYLAGAAMMLGAAAVAAVWAIAAERKPLETVARPLSARD
jgi:MFS family permease